MAKVTLVFAVLLVALGLIGYVGTGSQHVTALIPTWFGVALALFGLLAMSESESRRKLFMHINVTIGLLGFIGGASEIVRSVLSTKRAVAEAQAAGVAGASWPVSSSPTFAIALASKLTMTGLLLVYVIMCVRSFIAARRTGKV
ncbi:MAG: hypothetical protein WB561_10020 [Terracidiphilus sp.]